MNERSRLVFAVMISVVCLPSLAATKAYAEKIHLSRALSRDARSCLNELLLEHFYYPGDHSEDVYDLSRSALVGRAALNQHRPQAYIFLFDNIGWCGSAGCLLIVGERHKDGRCHSIYESSGSKRSIAVLRTRDHGYRRLYTPCEARFDSRQYQQVREECPTAQIHR